MTPRENPEEPLDSSDEDDPPNLIEENDPDDGSEPLDPDGPLIDPIDPEVEPPEIILDSEDTDAASFYK